MDKRMRVFVLSVAVVACVLYALGPAFGVIDVPAKFKDIPLYDGSKIVHAMNMENNSMLSATVKASGDIQVLRCSASYNEWGGLLRTTEV